ncbi:hypothetical protein ELY15_14230 [Legionella sp. km772]|nr:hypothetical protein ELY15_14230 [Legionella sp. km772]
MIKVFFLSLFAAFFTRLYALEVPIYDFPLQAYTQDITTYLPTESDDYSKNLLSPEYQQVQVEQFFRHYYASDEQGLSPWSPALIQSLLPQVKRIEQSLIDDFDNQKQEPLHYHFAENFKEHDGEWLNKIIKNMNLDELALSFNSGQRAIVVQNTFARALPDSAPDFFHFALAGQGFPFDNLQESALWVGTPIYVLHVSQDKAWSLITTPDGYVAWVKSSDLAYTSAEFIQQWQAKAHNGLMAITKTETSVRDEQQHFLFTAYIGAVFPLANNETVYIPLKGKNQQALLAKGLVEPQAAQKIPVPATKKQLVQLIKQLQNRPYGWGGAFFFNDCSQELKSLFTPLGIWLPRNSAQQAQYTTLDLSAKKMDERIATLKAQGHPLMTIVYIGGHVMLYLGNHENKPITYQNVWGLAPANKDKRYVIGQAVLLPLLDSYPEYPDAKSLANASYFKLIFLDNLPKQNLSPRFFVKQLTEAMSLRDAPL